MRLLIKLKSDKEIKLPCHYNHAIQSFIYSILSKSIAIKLHDEGFSFQKRRFKLFTFSRIFGRFRKEGENLIILPPLKLFISSPYTEMLESLASNLIKNSELKLEKNTVWMESLQVISPPKIGNEVYIKMLSPLTIYSTLYTPDGKKKTYYYNPAEKEFSELVRKNIIKKYKAFYERVPPSEEFFIEPVEEVDSRNEKIIIYKGFVIKGWMGKFKLKGEPELIRFSYDAGLGAKNSQGFGMWDVSGKTKKA